MDKENGDNQPAQVNVVVKNKRDIPINMLILVVSVLFSFYLGLKYGAAAMKPVLDAAKKSEDFYKVESNKAKNENKKIKDELKISLEKIEDEYDSLIKIAKENKKNSFINAEKFSKLTKETVDEITKLKESLKTASPENKQNIIEGLIKLEKKLEVYRENRLVYVCKNVPIKEKKVD